VGLRRTVRLLPVAVLTDSSLSTSFVACQPDTPKGMNVFIKPHRVAPMTAVEAPSRDHQCSHLLNL
jgi:hypothetical protein